MNSNGKVVSGKILNETECVSILNSFDHPTRFVNSPTRVNRNSNKKDLRSSKSIVFDNEDVIQRILSMAYQVNEKFFKLGPLFSRSKDPLQLIRYTRGDFFDWHTDTGAINTVSSSRVLSYTLQLNSNDDYEGGALLFKKILSHKTQQKIDNIGTITFFNSRIPHSVTPLESGTRNAIVGWLHACQ